MNCILFCEAESIGPFKGVQVRQKGFEERGAGRVIEEEGDLGVFGLLRFSLRKFTLGARILGFSRRSQ